MGYRHGSSYEVASGHSGASALAYPWAAFALAFEVEIEGCDRVSLVHQPCAETLEAPEASGQPWNLGGWGKIGLKLQP